MADERSKQVSFLSPDKLADLEGFIVGGTPQGPARQKLRLKLRAEQQAQQQQRPLSEEEPLADLTPEAIIQRSNFLPASFLERGAQRARAVCKIDASGIDYRGYSGSWAGTGFLVSENILLTNHHVLHDPKTAAGAMATFEFEVDSAGRPKTTRTFRLDPTRLFITSPVGGGLDYTFVWVEGSPGKTYGTITLDRRAYQFVDRELANIIQHPNGEMKQVTLQENEVSDTSNPVTVRYQADTLGGSSGSPVFNNEWSLVALHHAARGQQKLENEGILVSAIATDLERRAGSAGSETAAIHEVLQLFGGIDARAGFFGSLGRRAGSGASSYEAVRNAYTGELEDLDVGFWNIEWFNKHYERKLSDVADLLVNMNLDVWGLVEVSAESTAALVDYLNSQYGLEYKYLASEPDAPSSKQTTTVIWNTATASVTKEPWPDEIKTWLQTDSRNFDDLVLEAVEGRIFDRYPERYLVKAKQPAGGTLDFFMVPLHLKAMDEGSKRRRMASEILAAAMRRCIEDGQDADWVLGGDFNATLASDDFLALSDRGAVAISADDEQQGGFTYVKSPKSLIDHVFLSANMSNSVGSSDFFIVARDRELDQYTQRFSDHRPVVVRMSLGQVAPAPEATRTRATPLGLREALEAHRAKRRNTR